MDDLYKGRLKKRTKYQRREAVLLPGETEFELKRQGCGIEHLGTFGPKNEFRALIVTLPDCTEVAAYRYDCNDSFSVCQQYDYMAKRY